MDKSELLWAAWYEAHFLAQEWLFSIPLLAADTT